MHFLIDIVFLQTNGSLAVDLWMPLQVDAVDATREAVQLSLVM